MQKRILVAAAALLIGCTSAPSPQIEVTLVRAGDVPRGTISIVPARGNADAPEYQTFANAVGDALFARGYTIVPSTENAALVARINYSAEAEVVHPRIIETSATLSVRIEGRREGPSLWEGRVQANLVPVPATRPAGFLQARLATALFANFRTVAESR